MNVTRGDLPVLIELTFDEAVALHDELGYRPGTGIVYQLYRQMGNLMAGEKTSNRRHDDEEI